MPIHPFAGVAGVLAEARAEEGSGPRWPSLKGRTSTHCCSLCLGSNHCYLSNKKVLPTSHHTHCQKGKEQRQWQQRSEPFWDLGPNGSWLGAPARPGHGLRPRIPEHDSISHSPLSECKVICGLPLGSDTHTCIHTHVHWHSSLQHDFSSVLQEEGAEAPLALLLCPGGTPRSGTE